MEPKMLAAVAAIALLSAMLGGYMVQQKAVSTINEAIATQTGAQLQATCAPAKETAAAAATQQTQTPAATTATATTSKKGVSGAAILDEQASFKEFPWTKELTLEQGRYEVYFEADQKIKFMVYTSASGSQMTKVTTQFGAKCCESSGFYTVDINAGEGGVYKIVFDDSEMKLADARPTKGLVQIGRTSDI